MKHFNAIIQRHSYQLIIFRPGIKNDPLRFAAHNIIQPLFLSLCSDKDNHRMYFANIFSRGDNRLLAYHSFFYPYWYNFMTLLHQLRTNAICPLQWIGTCTQHNCFLSFFHFQMCPWFTMRIVQASSVSIPFFLASSSSS